jgi:hypothetical protein
LTWAVRPDRPARVLGQRRPATAKWHARRPLDVMWITAPCHFRARAGSLSRRVTAA